MTFFTQITMEAAEDTEFLDAMRNGAHSRSAGGSGGGDCPRPEIRIQGFQFVPATTWSSSCRIFGGTACTFWVVHFWLATDRPDTFEATLDLAHKSGLSFAQFVMLTPFAGTVDFEKWEKALGEDIPQVEGNSHHALLADSRRTSGRRCSCRIPP